MACDHDALEDHRHSDVMHRLAVHRLLIGLRGGGHRAAGMCVEPRYSIITDGVSFLHTREYY